MTQLPPRLVYILPSNRWSGVERYVLDLCRHFSAAGWPVDVFTRDARAVDSLFRLPGVKLHHARFEGWHDLPTALKLLRFIRRLDKKRPAVIHTNRYRDALIADWARRLAKRPDVKLVMTRHYVGPGKTSMLYRHLYHRLDSHLFVSAKARDSFLSAWPEQHYPFNPSALYVIHNSLLLAPDHVPAPLSDSGPVVAMYHGRLSPGKGLETLIDALAIVAARKVKMRLRITGTGSPDYADALRRRAQRLGVMERIDWTRHTADPLPLIAACSFGILPSEAEEAFGLANIEYMVQGRTLITTANGAQGEYLTDGLDAIIVPPGDAPKLADAMQRLAENPGLRTSLSQEAARSFNQNLSWPRFAAKMTSVYNPQH